MRRRLESLLGPERPEPVTARSRRVGLLVVASAAAAILLLWFGPFLWDPARLPPGPDVPWYIWRTELLASRPPDALVRFEGPLDAFKGAYRVANPILGGLFRGVADVDRYTLSMIFVAGWNSLAALAVGAAAYRYRRDPVLFAVASLFAAGTLLLNPFVGWVDNMLALVLAAAALCFLPGARRSWPPRIAIALLVFVAYFAHPPAAGVFTATLGGAVVLRMLLDGRRAIREEGPILLGVAAAGGLAVLAWATGIWGPGRGFREAVNAPPYETEYFFQAAVNWISSAGPLRFVPLVLAGFAVVVLVGGRLRSNPLRRAMVVWLLPVAGVLGYYLGLAYPYKRFLNVTLAPVLLAGIGTWAVTRAFLVRASRRGRRAWFGVAGVAVATLILAGVWADGLQSYRGRAHWMWPSTRSAMAVVRSYIAEEPDRPVVFVLSAPRRATPEALYGAEWRGNWSVLRAGLPTEALNRTYVYLGSIRDLLRDQPTKRGNATLDLLSGVSFRVMRRGLQGKEPIVFVIDRLNDELGNRAFIYSERSIRLGAEVALLPGARFAPPDPAAIESARAADLRVRRFLDEPPSFLAGPDDLLRGALGLALVLLLPGLLAARWFGVRDVVMGLGTIPALSLAMNATAGLLVLAVLRRPLSPGVGWVIVGVATLTGAALFLLSLRGGRATRPQEDRDPTPSRELVEVLSGGDGQGGGPGARGVASGARPRPRPPG